MPDPNHVGDPCGFDGISQAECFQIGCCFDILSKGSRCYKLEASSGDKNPAKNETGGARRLQDKESNAPECSFEDGEGMQHRINATDYAPGIYDVWVRQKRNCSNSEDESVTYANVSIFVCSSDNSEQVDACVATDTPTAAPTTNATLDPHCTRNESLSEFTARAFWMPSLRSNKIGVVTQGLQINSSAFNVVTRLSGETINEIVFNVTKDIFS